jgi:hypothetical protein
MTTLFVFVVYLLVSGDSVVSNMDGANVATSLTRAECQASRVRLLDTMREVGILGKYRISLCTAVQVPEMEE